MEAKVETVELSEKDNDFEFFFRLPSAETLRKVSKKFWKVESPFPPTIQDAKRIVINEILKDSQSQKTFTDIKIGTEFGSEIVRWLQDKGYTVIKTEKTNIGAIKGYSYIISWQNPDEQEESDTEIHVKEEE